MGRNRKEGFTEYTKEDYKYVSRYANIPNCDSLYGAYIECMESVEDEQSKANQMAHCKDYFINFMQCVKMVVSCKI
jgi:hypothetical protein